jgi:hypothetical protein
MAQTAEPPEFSLVAGGPVHDLFVQTRLLRTPSDFLLRRVIVVSLLAWLPLAVLTAFAGRAISGVGVPFLFDVDVHVRFLGALPLLLAAEVIVHARLKRVMEQFGRRNLVATEDCPRFTSILASATRLRNSGIAEVVIVVLAMSVGHWVWADHVSLTVPTWYSAGHGALELNTAGYWYAFVSLTIFRTILFRWYWRFAIWYRLLWQISNLNLRTNALHPDRAGGLAFLSGSIFAFSPVLVGQALLLSGLIANRIWHRGEALPFFKLDIAAYAAFLMVVVLTPLTFFFRLLARTKRAGRRAYGAVASDYVNAFREKWVDGTPPAGEPMLGSSDIQSLADLTNSYAVVSEMRVLPFSRTDVVKLAVLIAMPLLPLVLTMIPLEEMIDRVLRVFI